MVKEIHKLSCPFCGTNRSITPDFTLREFHIRPTRYGIISIREVRPGPGRGHKKGGGGFPNIGRMNIVECLASSEYSGLAHQIIERFESIWNDYQLVGIINDEPVYFKPAP